MGVTKQLASRILATKLEDIPRDVRHEARRALINYVGCALGGSNHAAVDIAIKSLTPFFGKGNATILGRQERADALHAALLNGIASHVHDFDDTTPKNYMHPTSPMASALASYASVHPLSGKDFELAFILGFETGSRVANSVYPAHYDVGWHITGTAGVFGAVAALGRPMGLTEQEMVWAIGLAAAQAAGIREMFGSMGKAFHPGRSAQSGYMAAVLAKNGFTGGEQGLEGPRGFAAVQAAEYDLSKVVDGFGEEFDLRENTYKPFPCGIVTHPTIDACIQLRSEHQIKPEEIETVRLRVAPLVKDLCDKKDISRGLEGKFSAYHAAAIGLVRGKAGLAEFTDEAVNDPAVKAVREKVVADGDPDVIEDGVKVDVTLKDGRVLSKALEESLGNLKRPLSDAQLEDKFRDQATMLSSTQVDELIRMCWNIDQVDDVRQLVSLAVPRAS